MDGYADYVQCHIRCFQKGISDSEHVIAEMTKVAETKMCFID